MANAKRSFLNPALVVFLLAVLAAFYVWWRVPATWSIARTQLSTETTDEGEQEIVLGGSRMPVDEAISAESSSLTIQNLERLDGEGRLPDQLEQVVYEDHPDGRNYYELAAYRHWGLWSFLPAVTAIALCWISKEPISALLAGIITGAIIIGSFNFLDLVLIPSIGTPTAAIVLVLYLWLLGGLMGIWGVTGASAAFAEAMTRHFVRGPRSAKVVAWLLGVLFFQGGSISSVLVGTTVKPVADKERVSHEELSLVVDSTSSPIAVLLAFNAWPIYVQAFLVVPGVTYLATVAGRVEFFFSSIVFSFYAMFAVLFTLLISLELFPTMPPKLRAAVRRSRETGQLDASTAEPLATSELTKDEMPTDYHRHVVDFLVPLVVLLGIAVGTFYYYGSPNVLWAFAAAILVGSLLAWFKGLQFKYIITGIIEGQKGVVLGSLILLLAITIGKLSQDVGGGRYLVSMLGGLEWHWILPALSFFIAVVIAFSTGTSWATFAVTFPLVMPLAHAVGVNQELAHPELYLSICFAACLNGGVFGDQCSPISDTTILSSLSTGADLMDHVKTQIPVASQAAFLALLGWTGIALFC